MRILILSNSEWNDSNSFGSSFSSIFGGVEEIEIANIYCRSGLPNTRSTNLFFQITEKMLIRNFFNSNVPSGVRIKNQGKIKANEVDVFSNQELSVVNFIRNNRWVFFYWLKDLIWFFGKWKSKELKQYIDDFNPDLIFLPVYYSVYLNKIGIFLQKYTNKPMVGYISDDNYSLKQFSLSPFFWIDRFIKRKWVKKAIDACRDLYVISTIQKKDYDKAFSKDCKILYKGDDFSKVKPTKSTLNDPISLVYTGNIGDGRYRSLASIGLALDNLNLKLEKKGILHIYSQTPLNNSMKKSLLNKKSIKFHGSINREKVREVQDQSDILVHVESLGLKERLQVRHSFSTKIVDYFAAARCIFAVGWKEAASIDYLIENDAAVVATSREEIEKKLTFLFNDPEQIITYGGKGWNLGYKKHQIHNIQKDLVNHLKESISNFENSTS